jgi:beta-lactamase class D
MNKSSTRSFVFLSLLIVLGLSGCKSEARKTERQDFKSIYDRYHVHGCFAMYDSGNDSYTFYNQTQASQLFVPASTFKICNSLIALESGVIKDEHVIFKWDSVLRFNPPWNKDQDMQEAFKNSTLWYYQELARKIGGKQMKYWLDKIPYGNADTSGGIDQFWLHGGLKISPLQQIDFLKHLQAGTLPFAKRNMDIVKRIMIRKDTAGYVLRGKTGWAILEKEQVGWFVGYIEKKGKAYFFASCIQCADKENPDFVKARIDIALQILKELKLDEN